MQKILVVDSVESNRKKLVRSLNAHGFATVEAELGGELVNHKPDHVMMVIMSQQLRDMNAFRTLAAVTQENPFLNGIPFLICTADNSDAFYRRCIHAGFKGLISTPYSRKSLISLITNVLVEEGIVTPDMFGGEDQVRSIRDEERREFLEYLASIKYPELIPKFSPEVSVGYYYPLVTDFFSLEPGEEFGLLNWLIEEGLFSRTLVRKVSLCPRCSFHNINVTRNCPKCNSIQLEDITDDYGNHTGYQCKSCGSTLENPTLTFECFNCGYSDNFNAVVIADIYSYTPTEKGREYCSSAEISGQ